MKSLPKYLVFSFAMSAALLGRASVVYYSFEGPALSPDSVDANLSANPFTLVGGATLAFIPGQATDGPGSPRGTAVVGNGWNDVGAGYFAFTLNSLDGGLFSLSGISFNALTNSPHGARPDVYYRVGNGPITFAGSGYVLPPVSDMLNPLLGLFYLSSVPLVVSPSSGAIEIRIVPILDAGSSFAIDNIRLEGQLAAAVPDSSTGVECFCVLCLMWGALVSAKISRTRR